MAETADTVGHLLEAGEDDDGNPLGLGIGFQVLARLEPVHLGHLEIEQDEMRRMSRHLLEGYFAVFRVVDVVAPIAEKVADHGPIVRVVVDDQNAVFFHVF